MIKIGVDTKDSEKEGYTKMVVLTRSRTGSNWLISLLNSHPDIQIKGEVFDWLRGRNSEEILKDVFPESSEYDCLGFKIFYNHPLDDEDKSVWELLKKDRSIKVVHLLRKNMLRSFLSHEIAEKNEVWSSKMGDVSPEDKLVHLDVGKLYWDFQITEKYIYLSKQFFTFHNHLEVTYEELMDNQDNCIKRVLNFLGLPFGESTSDMKRQNPEPLEKLISNYSEVHEKLSSTRYAHFLKE